MRSSRLPRMKWHVAIIVLFVLALSLFSWIGMVISVKDLVTHKPSAAQEAAPAPSDASDAISAEDPDLPSDGRSALANAFDTVDAGVRAVDLIWSVAKKADFSKIDGLLTYYGTGSIACAQVIDGSENWMFYKGINDGDPIGDYQGTNLYAPSELERIARVALKTQEELNARGIRFSVLFAPNKESIYAEYMPETYVHADKSRTDVLAEYLVQKGVNAISPKQALLKQHLSSQLYYSYDTHWNQLGAYIGVREALSSWGIAMPDLSDRTILTSPLKGRYHYCGDDDLARMTGLIDVFSDEIEYEVDGTVPMDWEVFESEQEGRQMSHFHNDAALNDQCLLLVGDSFRSSMVPSLREQFADVYVIHCNDYSPEILDQVQPDYLLDEYVERYSDNCRDMLSLLR